MLDILDNNIDPAQMEQIKSQIETLNLSPKEKKDIIRDLERLKLKWIPGSFNGIPKSFRMKQYVTKTPRPAY